VKFLNRFNDPNKFSLINLILPYIGIICIDQFISPLSNIFNTIAIAGVIIIFDAIFSKLLTPISKKIIINAFLNGIIICIFYGEIIIEKINKIIEIFRPSYLLNQWFIIIITFFIIVLFYFQIFKIKIELNRIIKTFFIIFSTVMITYKINQNKNFIYIKNNNVFYNSDSLSTLNKPTLLIIIDGYVSPDEVFNYTKNKNIYSLSDSLKQYKWFTINNFYSEEITTIHSLSSLFNFNLKVQNKKNVSSTFWAQKIIKSSLYDSLIKKETSVYNYGILDFGNNNRFTKLYYYYPTSITGQFFDKSMINIKYINNDKNLIIKQSWHNKFILDSIPKILIKNKSNKSFYYIHLLMPHDPYEYFNEFKNLEKNNPEKYIAYWEFTNNKLLTFLKKLTKENRFKIILTGDHGYGDIGGGIKANYTFGAFYGFNEYEINKLKSVQDIGNLINASFK
jgi:hypothetical protein